MSGCTWIINPDLQYRSIEKDRETFLFQYKVSKEIEPMQKDGSYTKWKYDIILDTSISAHISAGPQQGTAPASAQVLVKYSDEKEIREIWNYWDYSQVFRVSYSYSDILYFLVSDFFPSILGPSPDSNMYLYAYDLKLRKPIGRLKLKRTNNANTH